MIDRYIYIYRRLSWVGSFFTFFPPPTLLGRPTRESCPLPQATEMTRALVTLLLALQPGAAALANTCDNVAQLSDLKGEIYAIGGADASEPCGWHIYPDRRLQKMEFRVNHSTRLEQDDQLSFYSYNLQHKETVIGRFSADRPISHSMELRGIAACPKVPGSQQCSRGSGRPSGRERRALGAWLPKHAVACATSPIPTAFGPPRLRRSADRFQRHPEGLGLPDDVRGLPNQRDPLLQPLPLANIVRHVRCPGERALSPHRMC